MSSPVHKSTTTSTFATGPAVLVVDTNGRIELANAAAAAFWQARTSELVGDALPNLFAFEVTSADPELVQAQWEVVQSAALAQPITLTLQPKEAAAYDVVVRLEAAGTDPVRYFVTITRPAPAPTTHAAASTTADAAVHSPAGDHFLNLLADRSTLGFFDLNFVKGEAWLTPTWKRQLGHTDTSLPSTYESWLALIHPDDSGAAPDKLAGRAAPGGSRPFSVEYRMKHARGHFVWVKAVGAQLFAPNGSLQRVLGAQLDISERKEVEEASLRAEERLNALSDHGRIALFELDFTGGTSWLSPAFKHTLGFAEDELPDAPESFLRALPPEDSMGGLAAYFTSKHPGQPVYFDTLRLRHRNGTDLWAYAGLVRVISRKRELQRVLGFVAPMPEGVAASGSGPTPDQWSAALAETHEGVLLVDARDKTLFVNAAAERLLGHPADALIGQSGSELFRLVHRLSGAPAENPLDRAITTGESTNLNNEFALDRGTGSPALPIIFSCRAIIGTGDQPEGAVVIFRNPDEMSLTPEELVKANRFEALGHLAGGIAHDYNNVLTTIMGGISLALDARDYSGLETSMKACQTAKDLSRQLLTFSKGGTGTRLVVRPEAILKDSVRIAASGSTVQVELQAPADLGTILVDRAQMLQVFQNLIINAIQAMPSGKGNVWVTAGNATLAHEQVSPLPAGPYVAIEVRDNGSGIKPEHLQKIFDPFFTTKKSGTGLGLATVLSIIKRHGGQLGVESELGVGTTFTVFLPRAEQEAIETRQPMRLNVARQTNRVLFMDDDVEIRTLTEGMLRGMGYSCDLAANGEEAIKFYKRYLNINRPYDVVIMDLTVIGGMGGEDCYRALHDLDPSVRAIAATGYDNDEMRRRFLELGFVGYLTKPYRVGELGAAIKHATGT